MKMLMVAAPLPEIIFYNKRLCENACLWLQQLCEIEKMKKK